MSTEMGDISPEILEQTKAMKVLVVDDSRTLRRLLIRELNSVGITNIQEAGDGVEALQKIQAETFDLMLLDMEMPEMDGLETLKAVKSSPELRYLPIIVVSGSEHFERTIECIQVGAEDYLPKPFDPVLLRARVFSSLEKKRLRDVDRERIIQLQHEKELLNIEQMKTEKLMLNILPKPIAERLKKGESNISGSYPEVTILFSDLSGFTKMASNKTASELVKLLNDLFGRFEYTVAAVGGTSIEMQVISATDAALSTSVVVLGTTGPIAVASLTLGARFVCDINPVIGSKGQRYLGLRYISVGTTTAGSVFGDLGAEIQDGQKFYPSGFALL